MFSVSGFFCSDLCPFVEFIGGFGAVNDLILSYVFLRNADLRFFRCRCSLNGFFFQNDMVFYFHMFS